MIYKMFGRVVSIDQPNTEKNFQSFLLSVVDGNRETTFPFTCFERALTADNMNCLVVGNEVTVSFFLNSRETTSQSGRVFYNVSMSVSKIEEGDTTGIEKKEKKEQTNPVFAGGIQAPQTIF